MKVVDKVASCLKVSPVYDTKDHLVYIKLLGVKYISKLSINHHVKMVGGIENYSSLPSGGFFASRLSSPGRVSN